MKCEHCKQETPPGVFTDGTRNTDLFTDLLLFAWPVLLLALDHWMRI